MPPGQLHAVTRHLRRLAGAPADRHVSDADLLARYVADRDEVAFAALVERHGGLVWSVCRRLLHRPEDAEDAFQATFLVLVRKAASVRKRQAVASWLYGVAYRTAMKAKQSAVRRRRPPPPAPAPVVEQPVSAAALRELQALLDREVERLPEKYRAPFVLCCLGGKSQAEAARELGWKQGTVACRIAEARKQLRQRLARRGVELSAALCAVALGAESVNATVPAALVEAVRRFTTGQPASSSAAALAEQTARGMFAAKVKLTCVLALGLSVISAGAGVLAGRMWLADGARPGTGHKTAAVVAEAPPTASDKQPRADRYGDPLPAGDVARVGSVRWWHGRGHDCPLVYTPDGKALISCEAGMAIRFLDAATGQETRRIQPPGEDITSFALSPDGKRLITAGRRSPVLRLWDVATAKQRRQLPADPNGTSAVAFSPNGKRFAAATYDGTIRIWDVATWREISRLPMRWVDSCAFLPDGKTLIAAGDGIRWWDVGTGREIRHLDRQLDHFRRVAVSSDGRRLAAVVKPDRLQLWDATTGKEIRQTPLGGLGGVWCICFSPDGRMLACSGAVAGRSDAKTRFFAADTGRELRHWDEDDWVEHLAFSPDGKTLAQVARNRIRLREVATGKPAPPTPGLPDYALSVRFRADGRALVVSCLGGRTGWWDPLSGRRLGGIQDPPGGFAGRSRMLLGAALTADGRKAALVDARGALHVWEPATGKALCKIDNPPVGEDQADFSADGRLVVVKHRDGLIRLWDTATGKLRCALPGYGRSRFPLPHAFSPNGRVLATAPSSLDESVIRLWDTATGKQMGRLAWQDSTSPTCLLFSGDGRYLAAAHGGSPMRSAGGQPVDNTVRLWDVETGRERWRSRTRSGDIRALAISPDGTTLAAADHDRIVLWETASGRDRGRFPGHRDWIWSLAFSPDGRLLASGSLDYTALVWDVTGLCPDGVWTDRALPPDELEPLWRELAGGDAVRAYRALWAMVKAGPSSVGFLAARLRPVAPAEEGRLAAVIADLDSRSFAAREKASRELEALDRLAEPALRRALKGHPSPEARQRIERLLERLRAAVTLPDLLRPLRAVEVLEHVGTPAARRVLAALARGVREARLTREAKASLGRLSRRVP